MRASTCSTRPVTALETTKDPRRTTNIPSPGSPSRQRTWPRVSARSRMLLPSAASSASPMSLTSRTSRRNASVSAAVDTGVSRRFLGGHAADESGAEGLRALPGRGLGEPGQGAEHGATLVVVQLVLGQDSIGRALQVSEEVWVDHGPPNELRKALRHGPWIIPNRVQPRKGLRCLALAVRRLEAVEPEALGSLETPEVVVATAAVACPLDGEPGLLVGGPHRVSHAGQAAVGDRAVIPRDLLLEGGRRRRPREPPEGEEQEDRSAERHQTFNRESKAAVPSL